MKGKRIYLVIALSIVVSVVLVNAAYAITSSVQSDDNAIDADERSVDITGQTQPFSITPPAYGSLPSTVEITRTVEIHASDDVHMRAWVYLDDTSDWLMLSKITLSIYVEATGAQLTQAVDKYVIDNGVYVTVSQSAVDSDLLDGELSDTYYVKNDFDFGIEETTPGQESQETKRYQSFIPTDDIQIAPGSYTFDLTFYFDKLNNLPQPLYNQFKASFTGCVTFAISGEDPAPVIA